MADHYVYSGAGGAANGTSWANAFLTQTAANAAAAAGDRFIVAHDHDEATAGAVTLAFPGTIAAPCSVICADRGGSVPPVSADLRTTAVMRTTGNNSMIVGGHAEIYGITFQAGNSTATANLTFGSTANTGLKMRNCKAILGSSGSASRILMGGSSAVSYSIEWVATTPKFANANQTIEMNNACDFLWRDTDAAIDTGGTLPTILITPSVARKCGVTMKNLELHALGSGKTLIGAATGPHLIIAEDCKIDAAVTLFATPTATCSIDFARIASAADNYTHSRGSYEGTQRVSTAVKRTGGFSVNNTGLSELISGTANAKFIKPFKGIPIFAVNETTGSTVTVTVEGVGDPQVFSALPKNDEFWIDVGYSGDASSGKGARKSSAKADVLASGAAHTASTQAWDTGATARANSTSYALGDVIKLASNSGRIFICTTAGTSNGSEPAGYASAVDGGAVTDGTAVFKAGWRFKITVSLSSPAPAQAGLLTIYPRLGLASARVYLDPYPVLA